MKKWIIYLVLTLTFGLGLVHSVQGRDIFNILRMRTILNPETDLIEGEEVLEVTFTLRAEQWVPGVGWSLRYYDEEKQWLDTETTAYFIPSQNNSYLFKEDHFKGGNVFIALFPLRPDAAYLVFAIGDGIKRKVQLYPYTALLQDFNISSYELDDEIARSGYVVLEDESGD